MTSAIFMCFFIIFIVMLWFLVMFIVIYRYFGRVLLP